MDKKRIRRLGDILLDMEPLIQEAMDDHDLQWGDMLGLVYAYLQVHYPNHQEVYCDDESNPIFYYGPADYVVKPNQTKQRRRDGKPNKRQS